jgi:hypothetical protein
MEYEDYMKAYINFLIDELITWGRADVGFPMAEHECMPRVIEDVSTLFTNMGWYVDRLGFKNDTHYTFFVEQEPLPKGASDV